MPRKSTPSTASAYKQRPSGGTTGRPKVPKKDRNQPIVSIRVEPGSTPAHGVSGYPTTGIAGDFNRANSTRGVSLGNVDVAASRYSMQRTGGTVTINRGTDFNYATPAPPIPVVNNSNFTSEPVMEDQLALSTPVTERFLPRNQQLHAGGGHQRSSLMEEQAYTGYLSEDLYMQSQVPGLNTNLHPETPGGQIMSPARPVRLQFTPRPATVPRQDNQNSGTINQEVAIDAVNPEGSGDLHEMNDSHTPQHVTTGYSGAGTHMAHGNPPQQHYDGSWSLDVMPNEQPLMLSDLPPAADLPVQTYSGYTPQNTSIQYMRPSAGSLIRPSQQAVAIFT